MNIQLHALMCVCVCVCGHCLRSICRVQLWCHSCMVPQLDPAIGSNSSDNCGLDPIAGSNCGTIQLWYHRFVPICINLYAVIYWYGTRQPAIIKHHICPPWFLYRSIFGYLRHYSVIQCVYTFIYALKICNLIC